MESKVKMKIALSGMFVLGFAASVHAQYTNRGEFTNQPPGTGASDWTSYQYVNFAAHASTGENYPIVGVNPSNPSSIYFPLDFMSNSTTGHCYEIETKQATYANGDTRIWVTGYSGNPPYQGFPSLDDDSGDGYYSKARLWIAKGNVSTSVQLGILPYSSSYSTMDFSVRVTRLAISESSCTTNSGLPWLKKVGDAAMVFGNQN
jgi:hypothetical protein